MRNRIFFKLLAGFVLVIATAAVTLNFTLCLRGKNLSGRKSSAISSRSPAQLAHRVNTDHEHGIQDIVSQKDRPRGEGHVISSSEVLASQSRPMPWGPGSNLSCGAEGRSANPVGQLRFLFFFPPRSAAAHHVY